VNTSTGFGGYQNTTTGVYAITTTDFHEAAGNSGKNKKKGMGGEG